MFNRWVDLKHVITYTKWYKGISLSYIISHDFISNWNVNGSTWPRGCLFLFQIHQNAEMVQHLHNPHIRIGIEVDVISESSPENYSTLLIW